MGREGQIGEGERGLEDGSDGGVEAGEGGKAERMAKYLL